MRKTIVALAAVIVTILATFGLTACGGSSSASEQPGKLTGTWVSTDDSHTFVAEVTGGTIEIYIVGSGDKSLYWAGTFKDAANDNANIISAANKEQLASSMMGSQDSTKEFNFRGGNLYFDMSMMGTAKTVELEKNSGSTN